MSIDIANIGSSAMLSTLSFGSPPVRVMDKNASEKVADEAGAKRDRAKLYKVLISKEHAKVFSVPRGQARLTWYELTLPMTLDRQRIVPAQNVAKLVQAMEEAERKYFAGAELFMSKMVEISTENRIELGDWYSQAEDSRLQQEMRSKFKFRFALLPLPDLSKLGLVNGLTEEQARHIKMNAEKEMEDVFRTATHDIFNRVQLCLGGFLDRMEDSDNTFKEVTVTRISDLCKEISVLNFTNDPRVEAIRLALENKLAKIVPSSMRDDKHFRALMVEEAKAVKKQTEEYMEVLPDLADYL